MVTLIKIGKYLSCEEVAVRETACSHHEKKFREVLLIKFYDCSLCLGCWLGVDANSCEQ